MSQIVDRLKQVGLIRKEHQAPPGSSEHLKASFAGSREAEGENVNLSRKVLYTILTGWAVTLVLAIAMMASGGSARRSFAEEIARLTRIQNEKMNTLEKNLTQLETRHKKFSQSLDEKFNTVNHSFIKIDKQIQEVSSDVDTLNRNVSSLHATSRSIVDKFADLSNEVKTLKLLTAQQTPPLIETGRKR